MQTNNSSKQSTTKQTNTSKQTHTQTQFKHKTRDEHASYPCATHGSSGSAFPPWDGDDEVASCSSGGSGVDVAACPR
eukprot:7445091-Pyramimonas_sp.AAC.1